MTSINEQGAIFIKAREFIQYIRSTILYTEKLKEFREFVQTHDTESMLYHQLVYDFDAQEMTSGPNTSVGPDSNVVTLAFVSINSDNKVDVIEKVF
jgi:hypothetical protein